MKEKVNDGQTIINHVKGEESLADILTKSFGKINFLKLMKKIMYDFSRRNVE